MNVNIALNEADLGKLMRGEAINLSLFPASTALAAVNVNIFLMDFAFGRIYQQLREAMIVKANTATAGSLTAFEEGREDPVLQPQPKFKVGDQVKVARLLDAKASKDLIGLTGPVREFNLLGDGTFEYHVDTRYILEGELEGAD